MNDPRNNHPEPNSPDNPGNFVVAVPTGDHPITADHLANKAIALVSGALSEIVDVVSVHEDMAPRSACYVLELAGTLADTTIQWMHRWPGSSKAGDQA
ncbi:hypothetical protein [Nocardia abscessus]|uniref:hypothetical protein n=1 Tax=Nocardia abscessus TaxID=120957 RepID=UPI0024568EC2|nr:hypothetical protein [Nocardia abscessus]